MTLIDDELTTLTEVWRVAVVIAQRACPEYAPTKEDE